MDLGRSWDRFGKESKRGTIVPGSRKNNWFEGDPVGQFKKTKINKKNFQIILAFNNLVCYSVHNKRGKRRAIALDNIEISNICKRSQSGGCSSGNNTEGRWSHQVNSLTTQI